MQLTKAFSPLLIYLESQDFRERMLNVWKMRGGGDLPPKLYDFWEKGKQVSLYALDKLQLESHKIDITNGYEDLDAICTKLILK